MSVEAIVELIEHEAAEEASRIVADAETRASALVRDAEETARQLVAEAAGKAEPTIRAEATRRVNAARLRLLERRALVTARRIDEVITVAREELIEIANGAGRGRWATALDRLAAESIASVGPGAIVRVRAMDAPHVARAVAAGGGRVDVLEGADAELGIRASAPDGRIEVDATLEARLGRVRSRLAEDIARALGLTG
jgi:vacuolar-type H+-ATPase subunit E/Vma4